MTSFLSVTIVCILLVLITTSQVAQASSCCLRQEPLLSLYDGLSLQNQLMRNQHEDFRFLPNSPGLESQEQRDMIRNIIKLIQMQEDLSLLADSGIYAAQKRIMDVIVSDSCEYLRQATNSRINCRSSSELSALASRLEMYDSVYGIFASMKLSVPGFTGGSRNDRYAYWDHHVNKTCTTCSCPRLSEITNRAMIFSSYSDGCNCTQEN